MKNKLKYKLLHIRLLDFLLSCTVILASCYYSIASLFGVFNPIMWLSSFLIDSLIGKKGSFPQSIHEYSSWWDRLEFSFPEIMQFFMAGFFLCVIVYATFHATVIIAGYIAELLERNYIKYIFGTRFLRLYEKMQKRKGKIIACQNKKTCEKDDLNDATFEHYTKWKTFYKSDLSFDEWKNKVLNINSKS
ncbi:TPA: hypothetical protein ACWOR4_002860 [Escherichia coli]|uniref:hypothetical protein n=1 Tax=Escherichia coli TaxID=562 RepID=UPI000DF3D612|nr:hypothetical protein [Escherichia coli]EAR0259862.1 hypothetical protein [Salmonella enterica]ECD4915309.1 hypothetical protein [Salmonella enterica subsp. enterica serovar Amager]ECD7674967.1 hypothetical protein [Salmonella enterica subsp. enterica serovar Bareilly]EHR2101755.1 hypothetical protein [Salmonella enterica subsp. enterica serovar Javiana]RCP97391.1 hypothetical protein APT21_19320 [Escherichia coli]